MVLGPHLDERRNIPRAICRIQISCQNKDRTVLLNGTIKDLSIKGAQLKIYKKVPKGEILGILPPDSIKEAGPERIVGKVAWIRSFRAHYLIGLKFGKLPDKSWVEKFLRELGLQSTAPKQRREFVRFPTSLKIHCEYQGEKSAVVLKDLSLGGLFLESKSEIRENQSFHITLPKFSGAPLTEVTAVCRKCLQNDDGKYSISAQFENLTGAQRKKLLAHLKVLLRQSISS